MIAELLAATALFLAVVNGGNDNFKGFATSWGSGLLSYRAALIACTLATVAGGIASILIADGLIKQFSGRGLVPDDLAQLPPFTLAVAAGAGMTIALATRLGFPVSTTHAIVGGLTGAGLASGKGVSFATLGTQFLLPLLTSPFLSALLGLAIFAALRAMRGGPALRFGPAGAMEGTGGEAITGGPVLNAVHIFSAVAICFARAVNDAPKLAALLLGASLLSPANSAIGVTLAMAVGGWLLSKRVAETMSLKISQIGASQGLTANLIAASIVLLASKFSLPVSTTHVTVGAIIGTGAAAGRLDLSTTRDVLLSWLVTLPLAALCAAGVALAVLP